MKKIMISGFSEIAQSKNYAKNIDELVAIGNEGMEASDGYHTFGELYEHRIELFLTLCRVIHEKYSKVVWRSMLHADGKGYDGWFILGIGLERGEQISYHLPISKWDECNFAQEYGSAPEFDGHTSNDVLERLKKI